MPLGKPWFSCRRDPGSSMTSVVDGAVEDLGLVEGCLETETETEGIGDGRSNAT